MEENLNGKIPWEEVNHLKFSFQQENLCCLLIFLQLPDGLRRMLNFILEKSFYFFYGEEVDFMKPGQRNTIPILSRGIFPVNVS